MQHEPDYFTATDLGDLFDEGRPATLTTVSLVRGGQPRAYADHERIYRVAFFYVRGWGLPHEQTIEPDRSDRRPNEADNARIAARQIDKARCLVDAPKESQAEADWHEPYTDYAVHVAPNIVEVRTVTRYID